MQQRTLGDLRQELADRLNMSAQAMSPAIQRVLNSFLREAHDNLCAQFTWPSLRRDWIMPLVVGRTMYPLPMDGCGDAVDPLRIESLAVQSNTTWIELPQGIAQWRYTVDSQGLPCRYDLSHGNANPDVQPPGWSQANPPPTIGAPDVPDVPGLGDAAVPVGGTLALGKSTLLSGIVADPGFTDVSGWWSVAVPLGTTSVTVAVTDPDGAIAAGGGGFVGANGVSSSLGTDGNSQWGSRGALSFTAGLPPTVTTVYVGVDVAIATSNMRMTVTVP